jgi:hypothetical protein
MGAIGSTDIVAIKAELAHEKPHLTTMNLVVWIDSESKHDWVIERATKVSEKHPSRTIILDSTPGRTGARVRPTNDAEDSEQTVLVEI